MKFRNVLIIWLLLIFFNFSILNVKANPIPYVTVPIYDPASVFFYFFYELPLMFFITFNAEFLVVYIFLRKKILNDSKVYKSIFIINFFTFPLTQIFALFLTLLSSVYFLIVYFLIEIIPISLECFLINYLFKNFNERYVEYPGLKKTISIVITANLMTFLIGFGVYFPNIIQIISI
ncbi:MAG: hypothetical protein ACFFDX_03550 [Candidatus Odinarchaeota archaeon]